jgi:mannose-1-phosphate guanylyltransferase
MPAETSPKQRAVAPRRRYAVLMAGGSGTRFWPWSRTELPKQLLALSGERSMLAETVARLRGVVPPANVIVVTGKHLRRAVARDLPEVGAGSLLCEPTGRNTAACVGWAALEVRRRDPEGVMIVLPADHVVRPLDEFRRGVTAALTLADRERLLVTFGVKPTAPETGYGYIQAGRALSGPNGAGAARRVDRFHEKPSARRAKAFLRAGTYYWNSGMFAWRADVILEEIARHAPELAAGLGRLGAGRRGKRASQAIVDRVYPGLQSISVDHAILEKSDRVAMLPAAFEWSDIGSWDAVAALWPSDAEGNSSRDPLIAVSARRNVVATRGKPVALLGVEDLAVVDSGDAILVCRRERAQDVRSIVSALERARLERLR